MTYYEIMRYCRNFYPDIEKQHTGTFTVENGRLNVDFVEDGQLFLIEHSHFNDGVHEYEAENLRDETFTGIITPLCPPPDFLELCRRIIAWAEGHPSESTGQFQSESFGGYSYSRATDANGNALGWQDVFRKELYVWRKI